MSEGARSGAWAAQLIRATYGEGDRRRDEQFVENSLLAWLRLEGNSQRFMSALGVEEIDDEITIGAQVNNDEADSGRVDIVFHQREKSTRVELKLRAALTPAQTGDDYADFFIVPRGRAAAVQSQVAGDVVAWEDVFARLAGLDPAVELDRLRAFYEGMAYGTNPVKWPSSLDQEKLDELRAVARLSLGEFALQCAGAALEWDPIDWFTCTDRDYGEYRALDLKEQTWWWSGSNEDWSWEPDHYRTTPEPGLTELAQAMNELWKTTVQTGLGASAKGRWDREVRLSDEDGCQFGRYFWCHGYAVEVMLTFGSYDDARIIGLVVWSKLADGWHHEGEAWWPRSTSSSVDDWRRELVEAAAYCADGDLDSAFGSLEFAGVAKDAG